MIDGYGPVTQTLLGTLLTWGLTAAGAGLIVLFPKHQRPSTQRKILDGSFGFAAGVMLAASYWSLLEPAIEMAEATYGAFSFFPAVVGFTLGAAFVYGADVFMQHNSVVSFAMQHEKLGKGGDDSELGSISLANGNSDDVRRRFGQTSTSALRNETKQPGTSSYIKWRRILLLIVAITVHNIPEGLAVGVGFAAVGRTASATLQNARNLAIGIGLQNFPEGLAVSLPLLAAGYSVQKSIWYGQLSGVVEPIAGLAGAFAVGVVEPLLPYSLAFAAGAMIYVVTNDIIPEANTSGNGHLCSWCTVFGFIIMMSLDVGLG